MGTDWENILGDRVDLDDAYDDLVSGPQSYGDNSMLPYSLPEFDSDQWCIERYGRPFRDGDDDGYGNPDVVLFVYAFRQYAKFLAENRNNLPKSEISKAFAFFLSDASNGIVTSNGVPYNASDIYIYKELPSVAAVEKALKEPQSGYVADGDEIIDIAAEAFAEFKPSFDLQKQENTFAVVCDFVLACARANYELNVMEQNTDKNDIMANAYMLFTETPFEYTAVNWSMFDKRLEEELKNDR